MLQLRSALTDVVAQFSPVRLQFRKVLVEKISLGLGEESKSEIYAKRQKAIPGVCPPSGRRHGCLAGLFSERLAIFPT